MESTLSIVPALYIALPILFIILCVLSLFEFLASPTAPSIAAKAAIEIVKRAIEDYDALMKNGGEK